jgi:glycosyltransferase involved in cell wall biosynthesis
VIAGRVSVIVPSRNERFLPQTVADLLAKARGDVELIVVLDGYWPDPPLPDDPRLKLLHRGAPLGMRPAINAAARVATGEYLLKCDAHTMWAEGYDLQLKADYQDAGWILVPRRYALDPEAWAFDTSNAKYPIDYHYLSNPQSMPSNSTPGLHGTAWTARREARQAIELDEEMTSQGSGWFMSRRHWDWLGDLDVASYGNFVHEFQELGLKTWLGGGAVMVTKRTWYAHLYKGSRYGRGYALGPTGHREGTQFCTDFWMADLWTRRAHDLRWLIEKFAPVPTWPADLDAVFAQRAA